MTRTALARWAAAVVLGCGAATLAGCDDTVEPTRFTTVKDATTLATTTSDVKTVFGDAADAAIAAIDGEPLRRGDSVKDVRCGEAYPDRFRTLTIGGSFVAPGTTLAAAQQKVADAWRAKDWDVTTDGADGISLVTTTSTGIRVVGSASLQEVSGIDGVAVSLTTGTGCLELPADAD